MMVIDDQARVGHTTGDGRVDTQRTEARPTRPPFRFVSLGSDCQPAAQISAVQTSHISGVFDYLTTEIRHIARLIGNDFANFLERDNLFAVYAEQQFKGVVDMAYRVGFNHDFYALDDVHIQRAQDVYGMRIRWFRNLFDPRRPPPYFVRRWHPRDGDEDETLAVALFEQLRHMRRDIRFLYLHADPARREFMMDGYRSAYLRQADPWVWEGDSRAWRYLLQDFAIRPCAGDREAFELPAPVARKMPRFA